MRRAMVVALCALLAGVACRSDGDSASPRPSPSFPAGTVLIDTGEDTVLLTVEVAETDEQRQTGLMHRTSLPDDHGMVFVYFEDTTGGFYMKNTLIPLSIAFFDVDGRIVKILDMEPCRKDPCKVYHPGVPYRAALEVNQGAFVEWGVEVGDRVRLVR